MSWCIALPVLLAGACAGPTPVPSATIHANGFTAIRDMKATPGGHIDVMTSWHATCRESGRSPAAAHVEHSQDCHPVNHRLRIRCAPCLITAPDGHTADDELVWRSADEAAVTIEPRSDDLAVTVEFTAVDKHTVVLPHIRIVKLTGLAVDCDARSGPTPCESLTTRDPHTAICVHDTGGAVLGAATIGDKPAVSGCLPLGDLIPHEATDPSRGVLVPGDYPITVESAGMQKRVTVHVPDR
jgi:hypothetical protein